MSSTDSNDLYQALFRLYRQMFRLVHLEMHGKHELYRGQANLLLLILKNNGASQRELVEQLDIRPSSLTEMVTKMEQAGLITRRQDEKDQRVMRIYLTEAGRKAAEPLVGTTSDFINSIFISLTEEEKEQMLVITEKLCATMEAMYVPKADMRNNDIRHKDSHPDIQEYYSEFLKKSKREERE
ncbi:MarR family transcriptional regulator [Desulfosporosinus sp. PR]|uniref:MarR family winged helix-turn-helix transcriptional regulator n=1 Tax=Candidatus Desulfosporosinus nitrosoreducens TaxID=3401928 RepID=UPI0027F95CC4|nr:MarR family transcriptional regulator [Desulfosporosinus sp. PR]MDQ7092875.1 MarR family transcriptional regulator [Desulfosporosinus sp. PR]